MNLSGRRYWLIGASEGLGRALAQALSREGVALVLSARNASRLTELADSLPNAEALPLDVTDAASVSGAMSQLGEIDGVIYSVGQYDPMSAADWQTGAAEAMVEANFTGALRVFSRLVPAFIRRDRGHMVVIGSLAGFRGLPGAIGYGASKAALMHLAENIHADTRGTGVSVQVINPGFIRTRLSDKNAFTMPMIQPPEAAAARILKAMKTGRFSTSFPAPFSWLFTWGRFLPGGLFYRLF